jgi:hypothetical protein
LFVSNLEDRTDAELITLYGAMMAEMRRRAIVRSANNPIADIAERLVARHYGVDPEPPNSKAYDVVTGNGTTIQVKALRRTSKSRRNLSPLRSLYFDYIAAVIFENDMQLQAVLLVPVEVVREYMRWSKTWGANCLSITDRLQNDRRVQRLPVDDII